MRKLGSMKQRIVTLHKPVRLKFERRKTAVGGIDHQWQSDLCDIQNLQVDNDGYKYLLAIFKIYLLYLCIFKICNCFTAEKQKSIDCKNHI